MTAVPLRDPARIQALARAIEREATQPWTIMEVCGGQTHAIVRHGLDEMLPKTIELLHGPGCPVCVTPIEQVDRALAIAARPDVIFCSFGDMLRVPGSRTDLLATKAQGGDVRVVYAPLDAVTLAKRFPEKQVVFFAVGFETTAPAHAMAVEAARRADLGNFSILTSLVLVPPAIASILQSPGCRVRGFLGPGHVCTVMGTSQYEALANIFRVPIAITGFEPVDLLSGVLSVVKMLERGEVGVDVPYARAVDPDGNRSARELVERSFEVCDRQWRGIGSMPKSGLRLRPELARFDAERKFDVAPIRAEESTRCMAGQILRGLKKPLDCPELGRGCTPENPLGATMVSSEGACAAYHRYRLTEAVAS